MTDVLSKGRTNIWKESIFFFTLEKKRQMTDYWVYQLMPHHHVGSSVNSVFLEEIRKFWLGFKTVDNKKLYFEAYINNQFICLKIQVGND